MVTLRVDTGILTANLDAEAAAAELQTAIQGLTLYQTSLTGSTITATSIANESTDLFVTVTPGTAGDVGVTRTVVQAGLAMDTFTGTDGAVSVLVGGTEIQMIDAVGLTDIEVATALAAAFNSGSDFTATASDAVVAVVATATGATPVPTVVVTPGTDVDGATTDFAISRNTLSDGSDDGATSGTAASYSISVGGNNVLNGNLPNGASPAEAVEAIVTALRPLQAYGGQLVFGDTLRATSTFENSTPDIVLTVTPGTDGDGTTATLTSTKTVTQAGQEPTIDFTDTLWTYYVINQEVRVDDDLIEMMDDNSLTVRRGIIEDTQAWDDVSGNTDPNGVTSSSNEVAYLTESFSSSSRTTTAVIQLNMLGAATIFEKATDPVSMGFLLQHSTDVGVTWNNSFTTFSFGVSTSNSSLVYRTAAPISASNTLVLTPSQTYWFRILRVFTSAGSIIAPPADGNYTNFLVNMLVLEELTAS